MWIFYEVLWYLEQIYDPNKGKQKDTKEFCQSILKGKANGLGSPQVSTPSTPLCLQSSKFSHLWGLSFLSFLNLH